MKNISKSRPDRLYLGVLDFFSTGTVKQIVDGIYGSKEKAAVGTIGKILGSNGSERIREDDTGHNALQFLLGGER